MRRFGPKRFPSRPKPVNVGEEHEVDITEVSRKGDGLARIQGLVVFVPGAKAGQRVRIRITKVGGRFAVGELIQ